MTTYIFQPTTTDQFVDWSDPAVWIGGVVPDDQSAEVVIPVVALSANAMPRDIEKGLEAGFYRYLTKPIKVNEFMKTLDDVLKFAESKAAHTTDKDPA